MAAAAPWNADETRALFDAWRGTLEAPAHQREHFKVHMFQLFLVECGGKTERTESAVSSQYAALKNMGHLVMGFSDKPKWFALTLEQKHHWFKMVNRRTYKFVDLDEPMFQCINALIKQQKDAIVRNPSNLRIPLRRHGVLGFWEVHRPLADRRAEAEASVVSAASAFARPSSRIDAKSQSSSSMRAEPPRPPAIFHQFIRPKPGRQSGSGVPERAVSEGAAKSVSRAPLLHQFVSSSSTHRDDTIMVDGGAYDSGSSTESDSEIEGWQEPTSAVLSAFRRDTLHIKQEPTASANSLNDATSNASSFLPVPPRPGSLADLESKLSSYGRPNVSSRGVSGNSAQYTRNVQRKTPSSSARAKNQSVDPELLVVSNILEKQAQQLKEMLAQAKEERVFDLQARQRDQEDSSRKQKVIDQYLQQIELDKQRRQEDLDKQTSAQAERTQILKQIQLDHEERVKYQEERRQEQQQRKQLIEQMQMEATERQQERAQRKLEQEQRRLVLEQIKQDRQEREQAREERRKYLKQIQLEKEKQDVAPSTSIKLVNAVTEEDKENNNRQNIERVTRNRQQHRRNERQRTPEQIQVDKESRRDDTGVREELVEGEDGVDAKRPGRPKRELRKRLELAVEAVEAAAEQSAAEKRAVEAAMQPSTKAKKRAVEAATQSSAKTKKRKSPIVPVKKGKVAVKVRPRISGAIQVLKIRGTATKKAKHR
ncbi:hypothetical protein FI667_g16467, partial [Globisporangium splendens]